MKKIRANQIIRSALQVRKEVLGVGANQPICPYNLAEALDLELRFVDIPSFEGMYLASESTILISSCRPEGRKRFTCAHEIGHHILGHGTVIDEIIEGGSDVELEKEADFFASMLLMPSSMVRYSFNSLNIKANEALPQDIFTLSNYYGSSYSGLLTHLHYNLKLIDRINFDQLKRHSPSSLKKELVPGINPYSNVFNIGKWWEGRALDVVVDDVIRIDPDTIIEGGDGLIERDASSPNLLTCKSSGICKLLLGEWGVYVRIARTAYSGRYQFIYDEEV